MLVITGGAGFIGSALVWRLNKEGREDIIVVDRFGSDDKWKNLRGLRFKDVIGPERLLYLLEQRELRPDIVVHLGACSDTTEQDFGFLLENNYGYSQRLFLLSKEVGSRFVYASSAATYGLGERGFSDEHSFLANLRPLNGYAFSKHLFDLWLLRCGYLDEVIGIKYFNVFGPNEYHKGNMKSMVIKAFEQIRQSGKVRLFKSYNPDYPDGGQLRDFIYVKDAVEMTLFLMENNSANGIYNVGMGRAHSWVELVSPIFESLGLPVRIEFIDMPQYLQGKYQYFTCADMKKLKSLGYRKESWELSEAVKDYVENYLLPERFLGDEFI